MTTYQWLLGFHVLAAMLFLGGAVTVGVIHFAATRAERPSGAAALLRLTRPGVAVVGIGALASIVLGLALVAHLSYRSIDDAWIVASLALWTVSMVLGAAGGRTARETRYLAERLARQGDEPSAELRRSLTAPTVLAVNYTSLAVAIAILTLMVWKPS